MSLGEFCEPSDVVVIESGKIRGKTFRLPECPKVDCFLGIPYGKAERFQKPEPAPKRDDILDCSQFGPRAPQKDFLNTSASLPPTSEDCLNLNVFVPSGDAMEAQDKASGGRPVLVFIHGGGFAFHAASDYGDRGVCSTICSRGILLVTIQYRLGFFGFLSTGDSAAPGNYGLFDQALALQWVQRNIAKFGGDPRNVTVSGQSAGGASSDFLSISPVSRGLFQKVITMGGNAECHFAKDSARSVRAACLTFAKEMGFQEDKDLSIAEQNRSLVQFLRKLPASELEIGILGKPGHRINQKGLELVPVIDGEFLPKPIDELRREAPKKLCLAGATEYEGLFFMAVKQLKSTVPFMEQAIRRALGVSDKERHPEIVEIVTKIRNHYLKDDNNLEKAMSRIIGDSQISFSLPLYARKMSSAGHSVFLYSFDYARSGRLGFGNLMPFQSATHCSELPYLLGKGAFFEFHPDEEDKVVIEQFTSLIANFCSFGNAHEDWTPVSEDNPYKYFKIDLNCSAMREDYQERTAELWIEGEQAVKDITRKRAPKSHI